MKDALVAGQLRREQDRVVAHLLHLNRRLLQVEIHIQCQISRVGACLSLVLLGRVHLLLLATFGGTGSILTTTLGCRLRVQLKILQRCQVRTWITWRLRHWCAL